ncbi:alpha/beta fold hydrolase [Flavisphingomonas formosensis]|uniref:alpha/beta fold hydrolase n=1 Tax=Flavisphingomonas formosensis TaxID=861534 RepID=UPI0012FA4CE5|nr:alpha/beta hydrolase [Sphingomonas formosensis]
MRAIFSAAALALSAGSTPLIAQPAPAPVQGTATAVARNVVLVHGAWADGSSWSKVIPLLQAAGLHVTSVQNSLTSLEQADADVRRALAAQDGPTVLVGHSWSGTVVSDVGDDPKVSALVYVAARAPAAGEDFLALQQRFPNTPARAGIVTTAGFTTLSQSAFLDDFANGVPKREAMVLFAEQGATAASLFGEQTTATAWSTKPSYYAVSRDDRTIAPEFESFLARRMHATTVELAAGHLSMVSRPREIADLIIRASGVRR